MHETRHQNLSSFGFMSVRKNLTPKIRLFFWALALQLIVTFPSLSAEVQNVRIGIHPGKTRIVLDVDSDTLFSVSTDNTGNSLIIELPNTALYASASKTVNRGLVQSYEFKGEGQNQFLLVNTTSPVQVERAFNLAPSTSGGHRIVIDIVAGEGPQPDDTGNRMASTVTEERMNDNVAVRQLANWKVSAGPDAESRGSLENMRQNLRRSQTAQYIQPTINGNGATAPHSSSSALMGGADIFPSPLDRRYYVAVRLGASFQMDSTNKGQLLTLEATPDRAGYIGAGALGINLGNGFQLEGEASYAKSDLKFLEITKVGNISGISVGTSSVEGNVTTLSFMANGAYQFRNRTDFTPYLKGGIGVSSVSANDVKIDNIKIVDDNDLVFAYQFGAGINVALNERTSLDFEYRYFATSDPSFTDAAGDEFTSENSSHNFLFGLRYSL